VPACLLRGQLDIRENTHGFTNLDFGIQAVLSSEFRVDELDERRSWPLRSITSR